MSVYDSDDWRGFLAAIRANPGDDTPRLIAADWLDDGCRDPARAEFIRVQVEIASMRTPPDCTRRVEDGWEPRMGHPSNDQMKGALPYWDLRRRERELLGREPDQFVGAAEMTWLPPGLRDYWRELWINTDHDRLVVPWEWVRGFVSAVAMPGDDWVRHADAILARHPVESVTLTTTSAFHGSIGTLPELVRLEDLMRSEGVSWETAYCRTRWPQVPAGGWHLPTRWNPADIPGIVAHWGDIAALGESVSVPAHIAESHALPRGVIEAPGDSAHAAPVEGRRNTRKRSIPAARTRFPRPT